MARRADVCCARRVAARGRGCARSRERVLRAEDPAHLRRALLHVPQSRRGKDQGRPRARFAGGRAQRRRQRSGDCSGRSRAQPADQRGALHGSRPADAAEGREAFRRASGRPRGVGQNGRAGPAAGTGGGARAVGSRAPALGVSAVAAGARARGEKRGVGEDARRSFHPREAGGERAAAGAARRPPHAVAACHVRFDGIAAHRGGGGGVRAGRFAGGVCAGGRPFAGVATLRGALGALLARCRPLRRHQGLRVPGPGGEKIRPRLCLPRLGGAGLERGPALRPLFEIADRRRPDTRRRTRRAGGDGISDAGPAFFRRGARYHRRPHRHAHPRHAGADGQLRALPRPQVRSDTDAGLLFALRRVCRHDRADRGAGRGPAERPRIPRLRGGAEAPRGCLPPGLRRTAGRAVETPAGARDGLPEGSAAGQKAAHRGILFLPRRGRNQPGDRAPVACPSAGDREEISSRVGAVA